jgi:flagellar biogenesis protein FliO
MPFLARIFGVLLLAAGPASLGAQTYTPFPEPREAPPLPNPVRYDVMPAAYDAPLPPAAASRPLPQSERAPGLLQPPTTFPQGDSSVFADTKTGTVPAPAPEKPAEKPKASVPLVPAHREAPLPLPPPGSNSRSESGTGSGSLPSALTVAASLATVLGIFFLAVWLLRRATPQAMAALPKEVVEVLGRAPLTGRQQMHLLRCGNKLLLVSITPTGAETLTEITDPVEIDRLAGLCQQARPNSATATFRRVFQHFSKHGADSDAADGYAAGRQRDAAFSARDEMENRHA